MSTLKVNKLRDTAGSADAITLDPNGGAVLAGVTTVSTVKVGSGVTISSDGDVFTTGITTSSTVIVGSGVTISESGIEASGIGITCANINGTQIGGRRNIIINGAMNVAQRGTSSTSDTYATVDRFSKFHNDTDESPTQAQVDVASGTTPYTNGFRKAFKITNGNQTSGAGAADVIEIITKLEAQDMAQCGWNYTSTSSFVTLSFWVKSSVAQNFYGHIKTTDGTAQNYPFETGSLSADTWTKITKTIPGNSNLQFDNDKELGLTIKWIMFRGTNTTDSGVTLNAWTAFASGTRTPDSTSTWYTTNDATFEITGVQLEVGSQATAFEHRSPAEELRLCQRYFHKSFEDGVTPAVSVSKCIYMFTRPYTSGYHEALGNDYIVEMRTQPSVTFYPIQGSGSAGQVSYYDSGWSNTSGSYHTSHSNTKRLVFSINTSSSTTLVQYNYTADAEL